MTWPICGHKNQLADDIRLETDDKGVTHQVRMPKKFRVRGPNFYFCLECEQIVDDIDDQEADGEARRRTVKRA